MSGLWIPVLISGVLGLAFGWLPWQVGAIFAALLAILIIAFSRMIDWSDPGAGFISFLPIILAPLLPVFAVGTFLGIYMKRRSR